MKNSPGDFLILCPWLFFRYRNNLNKLFLLRQALAGDCGFMAANLYARSIFGEDALANVSIEKPSDQSGPSVTGHVRIRAKSQVISIKRDGNWHSI